jgi:hypothetical protein
MKAGQLLIPIGDKKGDKGCGCTSTRRFEKIRGKPAATEASDVQLFPQQPKMEILA